MMNNTSSLHMRSARDTVRNPSGLIQVAFLRTTTEVLREMISKDRSDVREIKQELALIEQSDLYVKKHYDGFVFSKRNRSTKKEKSINRDRLLIHQLARKAFLEQRITDIELHSEQLQRVFNLSQEACERQKLRAKLTRFADAGLDLSRIIFTNEQNEWIDAPYTPDPFHRDNLIYPTAGGILMRSLSETMIGSELEKIGLPYRFDDLVRVGAGLPSSHGERPHRNSYFADFKVPNLDGGITIHEHFGAFQIENYAINALKRLNDYQNYTLYELPDRPVRSHEITWSFQRDVIDPNCLKRVVHRMLLPVWL